MSPAPDAPFVRFSRDSRGYEYVYLMHVTSGRPARSRVLYWFRTPPGVKVGRQPFDVSVQRALEAQYPGLRFDWKAIVETQPPPPPEIEPWRERRRAEKSAKQARLATAREDLPPLAVSNDVEPQAEGEADLGEVAALLATEVGAPATGTTATSAASEDAAARRSRRRRRGGRGRRGASLSAPESTAPVEPASRGEPPSAETQPAPDTFEGERAERPIGDGESGPADPTS